MKKILMTVLLLAACGDDTTSAPRPPSYSRDMAAASQCPCSPPSCKDSGYQRVYACQGTSCVSSLVACQYGCDNATGACRTASSCNCASPSCAGSVSHTQSCQSNACVDTATGCAFGCDATSGLCMPNPNPGGNS